MFLKTLLGVGEPVRLQTCLSWIQAVLTYTVTLIVARPATAQGVSSKRTEELHADSCCLTHQRSYVRIDATPGLSHPFHDIGRPLHVLDKQRKYVISYSVLSFSFFSWTLVESPLHSALKGVCVDPLAG